MRRLKLRELVIAVVGFLMMAYCVYRVTDMRARSQREKEIRAEYYKKGVLSTFVDVMQEVKLTSLQKENLEKKITERLKAEKEKITNAR